MHCVHCFSKQFVMHDSIRLMFSSPYWDLANQEWLLSGPDVCLVTLTLQQPIVTKNTCFYGSNAVLHRVLLFALAMQLRLNCFDDLFVPTDYVLTFASFAQCTVHVRSSIRQPFGDLVSVCFHTSTPFQHPLRNCTRFPPYLQALCLVGWQKWPMLLMQLRQEHQLLQ